MEWCSLHKLCIIYSEENEIDTSLFEKYKPELQITTCLGSNSLHLATLGTNLKLVGFLLNSGVKFRQNTNGETPLHWAVKCSSVEVVNLLLSHLSRKEVLLRDIEGKTAKDWARDYKRKEMSLLL